MINSLLSIVEASPSSTKGIVRAIIGVIKSWPFITDCHGRVADPLIIAKVKIKADGAMVENSELCIIFADLRKMKVEIFLINEDIFSVKFLSLLIYAPSFLAF